MPGEEKGNRRYVHVVHEFDPVFDCNSKVLVLGSFPSVKSRQCHFYYGNPQNRFWKVMANVLGTPLPSDDDIAGKTEMLLENRIALWDVIASCDIIESSDSSIRNAVPNDVPRIVNASGIDAVIANGRTAEKLYARYLEKEVGIGAVGLPSTSPANAAWSLDALIKRWGETLLPLLG